MMKVVFMNRFKKAFSTSIVIYILFILMIVFILIYLLNTKISVNLDTKGEEIVNNNKNNALSAIDSISGNENNDRVDNDQVEEPKDYKEFIKLRQGLKYNGEECNTDGECISSNCAGKPPYRKICCPKGSNTYYVEGTVKCKKILESKCVSNEECISDNCVDIFEASVSDSLLEDPKFLDNSKYCCPKDYYYFDFKTHTCISELSGEYLFEALENTPSLYDPYLVALPFLEYDKLTYNDMDLNKPYNILARFSDSSVSENPYVLESVNYKIQDNYLVDDNNVKYFLIYQYYGKNKGFILSRIEPLYLEDIKNNDDYIYIIHTLDEDSNSKDFIIKSIVLDKINQNIFDLKNNIYIVYINKQNYLLLDFGKDKFLFKIYAN